MTYRSRRRGVDPAVHKTVKVLLPAMVEVRETFVRMRGSRADRSRPGPRHDMLRQWRTPLKMTGATLRLALASTGHPNTKVSDRCAEPGITRQTPVRVYHLQATALEGQKLLSL
jgi:hypothetical protein